VRRGETVRCPSVVAKILMRVMHPPDTLKKNSANSLHLKKHGLAMFKLLERSCVPGFQE
jgi:hypothetical protein